MSLRRLETVKPKYWYFGHMHNGVVYSSNATGDGCKSRCVGHGAMPFGNGNWLAAQQGKAVEWYATKPLTGGGPNLEKTRSKWLRSDNARCEYRRTQQEVL